MSVARAPATVSAGRSRSRRPSVPASCALQPRTRSRSGRDRLV